jgi:hypothetical protein
MYLIILTSVSKKLTFKIVAGARRPSGRPALLSVSATGRRTCDRYTDGEPTLRTSGEEVLQRLSFRSGIL